MRRVIALVLVLLGLLNLAGVFPPSPAYADDLEVSIDGGDTVIETNDEWYKNPVWILVIFVALGLIILVARRR